MLPFSVRLMIATVQPAKDWAGRMTRTQCTCLLAHVSSIYTTHRTVLIPFSSPIKTESSRLFSIHPRGLQLHESLLLLPPSFFLPFCAIRTALAQGYRAGLPAGAPPFFLTAELRADASRRRAAATSSEVRGDQRRGVGRHEVPGGLQPHNTKLGPAHGGATTGTRPC